MVNKKMLDAGCWMLVMAMVFGLALAGCKQDSDDDDGGGGGGDSYLIGTWKPASGDPILILKDDKSWKITTQKGTAGRYTEGDNWYVGEGMSGTTLSLDKGDGFYKNQWTLSFTKVSDTKITITNDVSAGVFVSSGGSTDYEKESSGQNDDDDDDGGGDKRAELAGLWLKDDANQVQIDYEGGGGLSDPLYFMSEEGGSLYNGNMVSYDGSTAKVGDSHDAYTPITFTATISNGKLTISGLDKAETTFDPIVEVDLSGFNGTYTRL